MCLEWNRLDYLMKWKVSHGRSVSRLIVEKMGNLGCGFLYSRA